MTFYDIPVKITKLRTDESAEKLRFVAGSDKQEIDRQPSGNECQGNETLGRFVEQWKQDEEQHDEQKKHWQEQMHLQRKHIAI